MHRVETVVSTPSFPKEVISGAILGFLVSGKVECVYAEVQARSDKRREHSTLLKTQLATIYYTIYEYQYVSQETAVWYSWHAGS